MDAKLIREAKEIPSRLKQILHDMFEASEPALKSSVATLRSSLSRLDGYLQQVEREHLGAPATKGAKTAPVAGTVPGKKTRLRRRRKGSMGVSDMVLAELGRHPKGLRPFELSALVAEATGMDKKRSTGNVTTALYRLKKTGAVAARDGVYIATQQSAPAAAEARATKKTRKRRGRKKATAAAA